jgi:hypothetical protein
LAYFTFADGAALPAADLNTYLMKQAVIVCTAGTRPASPIEGMTIYETDTDKLLIYTTATTLWQQPWNMPWGLVLTNSSQPGLKSTVNSASFTVLSDILGPDNWTLVKNRRYKLSASLSLGQTGSGTSDHFVTICKGDNTILASTAQSSAGSGITVQHTLFTYFDCTVTGTQALKIRASNDGNFAMYMNGVSPYNAYLIVEDIGPSAAPA